MVALKILRPAITEDEEDRFTKRFRLEAEALAALKHPNIVTIYDYGETDEGGCFLAMEYVEGHRFNDLLKNDRRPDPARMVRLTLQVCSALQYAHHRGVIHRDVKLSNILIEATGGAPGEPVGERAKVVDFGLAKLRDMNQDLTRAGTVLGSPHFMAPEQIREEPIDHRVDIYSVGVLLFCGLTGRYPFHGQSKATTIAAHLAREIPSFQETCPDARLPARLEAVVRKCLAKRADDRYPDMGALMVDLTAALEDLGATDDPAFAEDTLRVGAVRTAPGPGGLLGLPTWAVSAALGALLLLLFVGLLVGVGFVLGARAPNPPTDVQVLAPTVETSTALQAPPVGSPVETAVPAPDPAPTAAPIAAKPRAPISPRAEAPAPAEPPALEPPAQDDFKQQPDYRDPWAEP